jgi:hypothetical protein
MQTPEIIAELDSEIARLQQVKALLSGFSDQRGPSKRRAALATFSSAPKKRQMSAEGRARIAAAQKARWAKTKKAAK